MRKKRASRLVATALATALCGTIAVQEAFAAAPVVTAFDPGGPLGEPGGSVAAMVSFTDTDLAQSYVVTIQWGDGSPPTSFAVGQPGTYGPIPHNYSGLIPGARTAYVAVSDSGNQFALASASIVVDDFPPQVTASPSATSVAESDRMAYRGSLSGANVFPPVVTSVTGRATLVADFSARTLDLDVVVSNLAVGESIAFARVRMGDSREEVGRLFFSVAGGAVVQGPTTQSVHGIGIIDETETFTVSTRLHVEVETSNGTLLAAPLVPAFTVEGETLSGAHEVTPTAETATGTGTLALDRATNTFDYVLDVNGLAPASVTGLHVHRAAAGVNGPIVVDLMSAGFFTATQNGFRFVAQGASLAPADFDALATGGLYVNVHANANPNGAIRGQLDAPRTFAVLLAISDPGVAQPFTASIDFGDEQEPTTLVVPAGTTNVAVAHLFRDDRSVLSPDAAKTVTWRVSDAYGGTASGTTAVTVANVAPVGDGSLVKGETQDARYLVSVSWRDPGSDQFTVSVRDSDASGLLPTITATDSSGCKGCQNYVFDLRTPGDHVLHFTIDDGDGGILQFDVVVPVSTIAFDVAPNRIAEGQTQTVTLQVKLAQPSATEVTVGYQTFDGTARAGADYEAASGRLVFAPGEDTATINVNVGPPDFLSEDNESFFVALFDPTGGYVLGSRFAIPVDLCDARDESRLDFDLGIGKAGARRPIGLKRFGTDGAKQTLTLKTKPGATLKSTVTVVNSGPYARSATLVASPSVAGFEVKYLDPQNGDADITAALVDPDPAKAPTFLDMNPGERRRVNVEVRVAADAASRTSTSFLVRAYRDCPYIEDVVREDVVVK